MAAGDYVKTTYINGQAPARNATNLNNHENKTKELDTEVVALKSGAMTIDGVKTFLSSPIVPTATTGTQAVNKGQLDLKANIDSPSFTGVPLAPTGAAGLSTTQIATAAFVQQEKQAIEDMRAYRADKAYEINEPTFYLGVPYKSIFVGANTGNTPSTSPTHWEVTGGGSGSATNVGYDFENGQFETHTIGWTRYADAAGVIPVDGTGGLPNASTTFLRNDTVAPINGLADAILSKDAENRQGEGVSYDFTIDPGQTTSPAQITFTYKTPVEYLDGYLGVFLYDKTNGALIRLSVENIPATYGSISQFLTTFIPSNSLEYRLIFHVITDTAPQWTFEVDNIQVGQKNVAVGAAIGNWIDYTSKLATVVEVPAQSVLSVSAKGRRVGENLELVGEVTATSNANAGGYFGLYLTSGSGISINASVFSSGKRACGCWNALSLDSGSGVAKVISGVNIIFAQDEALNGDYRLETVPNGTIIAFSISVPIAQWTSNVNMASDFTEYAYNSSTTATTDTMSFGYGQGGALFQAFAPSGTNTVNKRVRFSRPHQSGDTYLVEFKNDYGWVDLKNPAPSQGNDAGTIFYGHSVSLVNATDLDIFFYSKIDKSNSWSVFGALRWRVRKVSNGNMAEVPPVVRAEYNYTSTVLANTDIIYTTKDEDTHSAYNTTNGRFTAPVAGIYSISAVVALSATTSDHTLKLFKNGSFVKYFGQARGVGVGYLYGYPTKTIRLLAGDYITIQCSAALTAGVSDAYRIEITRIGS